MIATAEQTVENFVQKLEALEVAANTVQRCYTHRPENFAYALHELEVQATEARRAVAAYRAKHPALNRLFELEAGTEADAQS